MKYTTIAISPAHKRLLKYIVAYRKLRGRASASVVAEQLILSYAKQLATGMPERLWHEHILTLINECEDEHTARHDKIANRQAELEKKALTNV